MKSVGVAILGLGVVGSGTYKILRDHREFYRETQDVDISVESVLEINQQKALALGIEESKISDNIAEVVTNPNVDIVVEVIGGVEPARTFVLAALNSGKSVVTSNKELFCKYWHELERAAKKTNAGLYFEASCVGGVPIIRTLLDGMQANKIRTLKGIINGTTNYILTRMTREGAAYGEILKDAQSLGYAEANPEADVEGFDSSYKLSILASLAFNKRVPADMIYREGITHITAEDMRIADELGYVIKLLAIAKNRSGGKIEARVHPVFLPKSHPLANVNDSFNGVFVVGDAVGDVMLYGRGAGELPTGSAIVSDVIYCARNAEHARYSEMNDIVNKKDIVADFESEYYLRMNVHDVSGVLADVANVFKKHKVSIARMRQDEGNDVITVIFITHMTHEAAMKASVEEISRLDNVISVENVIRVEK